MKFNPSYIPSRNQLYRKLRTNLAFTLSRETLVNLNIRIIEFDTETGLCIVRCDHRVAPALREVIKMFGEINLKSIQTSGSIKTLKQKLLTYEL